MMNWINIRQCDLASDLEHVIAAGTPEHHHLVGQLLQEDEGHGFVLCSWSW
jgi:hypothetical protein